MRWCSADPSGGEGDPGQARSCRFREPTSGRRSDNDPAVSVWGRHVHNGLKRQLLHKEPPTPLLIPDPERHKIQPKKRLQECRPECRSVRPKYPTRMLRVFHRDSLFHRVRIEVVRAPKRPVFGEECSHFRRQTTPRNLDVMSGILPKSGRVVGWKIKSWPRSAASSLTSFSGQGSCLSLRRRGEPARLLPFVGRVEFASLSG